MCILNYHQVIYVLFLHWCQFEFSNAIIGEGLVHVPEDVIPFVVGILFKKPTRSVEKNQKCGGSLIARSVVLTAAHCVEDVSIDDIEVHVGDVNLRRGSKYDVSSAQTFDTWAWENERAQYFPLNDIAIIKLTKEVDPSINEGILSISQNNYYYGRTVLVVGWGETNHENYPEHLRGGWVRISGPKDKFPHSDGNIYWSEGNPPVVMLPGDSGSPLLLRVSARLYVIIGVATATGPKCYALDDERRLNAHTSIDPYRDFINDALSVEEISRQLRQATKHTCTVP